ncbi:MAG: MarR family transcriptional regulator [Candidatus Thorarchaeota archaeon]|nr:MAG: MarR family transcriptional regulator [Candidatus Thorarchaeota archaeon]
MSTERHWGTRVDALLVAVAVFVLLGSVWIWLAAMPIAREVVILAATIALVVSLVLVVNVFVLILFRLQRRITDLEERMVIPDEEGESPAEDRVIVVTLTNVERRILNRLEESGGHMSQDELRRVTGISKSTLSVSLSALERKSLIAREESGRTKTVILKKSVPR